MERRDVVVVGGGCIGLAVAWESALAGLSVTLVDPEPGSGASFVAAGMLAPVSESSYGEEALLQLNLASAQMYPDFVERLEAASGEEVGYWTCGALNVALDAGDRALLDEVTSYHRRLGLQAEPLSPRQARRLEPALSPGMTGAVLVPQDHQVDPRKLTSALLRAAEVAGVTIVRDRVNELLSGTGRASGVALAGGGSARAQSVVVAAGCWSKALVEGLPGVDLPVRPVKGQLVVLRRPAFAHLPERLITRTVIGIVEGHHVYVVPRQDGRVMVGATMEERGFDQSVTVEAIHRLLHDSRLLVPATDEMELVECLAGFRPGSPDNGPMIGPTSLPGVVAATGHFRNGVLLTPITARAIAEFLTSGELPDVVKPFSPLRFSQQPACP